jgi:hypothetical protein
MQESHMVGTEFAGETLAPAFKSLCAAGRTGVLTVSSPPTVRTILLQAGQPVFANSNNPDERFNGFLMRNELVSFSDLMRAVELMVRESLRLGEILVREEILDPPRVAQGLQLQVHEIACRALVVREGRLGFSEEPVPAYDDVRFRVPANTLIREAFQTVNGLYRILREIGGTDAVYAPADRFDQEVATAGLSQPETRSLPLFREPRGLAQLCNESVLPDFQVCRLVWTLLTIGAITRLE